MHMCKMRLECVHGAKERQEQQTERPVPLCWPADGKTNLTIIHIPQSLDWGILSSRAQAVDKKGILPFKLQPEILRLNQVP